MNTSSHPLDRHFEQLGLRERKKLKIRRAIQDHALRLFAEQGYHATTVEQIAAAAEVSPSTFFRYYATKEDVVLTDEYDPVMAELFRALPAELSPLEALRRMFAEVLSEMYTADEAQIRARIELIVSVPELRARAFDSMAQDTTTLFTDLVAERSGRPADDPLISVLVMSVIGAVQACLVTWIGSNGEQDLVRLIDEALVFLAAGCEL